MTDSPLFSIVIPTRNRAKLLPHALASALDQTFDDFEIVVVANNCEDDTRQVVHRLATDRVRYFETDTTLTMPDNWEFAWTLARGRYVTYLPDDDALVPSALQTLVDNSALEGQPPVVSWEDAPYYYPDWGDTRMRNTLLLFFFGGTLVEDVPAEVYRRQCADFNFAWSSPLPKLLNCAADREFFDHWRTRLGRLFWPVAPDYSFAWLTSHICPSVRVVHRPLSVRGISDHSIGSNAGLGAAGNAFFAEFGEFDFFADAPLRLHTSLNHIAATFTRASRALQAAGVSAVPLDKDSFLVAVARQLAETRDLLPDWNALADELRSTAQSTSSTMRQRVDEILDAAVAPSESETIAELRARTARMALENPINLKKSLEEHADDHACVSCVLGLEPGILAEANWSYLYLIGDEMGVSDPHAMSALVDRHYNQLTTCRAKQRQVLAVGADTNYGQQTDLQLLTELLRRLDNKVAIDVGAEKGSFVRAFIDNGANCVIAIEPHPGNAAALRDQFYAGSGVRTLEVALGAEDGTANLYIAEDKTGMRPDAYHSLVAFQETPTIRRVGEVEVQVRSLASLLDEGLVPPHVGVLKIDAERSDFDILKGMGRLLADVVMLEYWDDLGGTVGPCPYRLSDVVDFMAPRGYSNFAVVKRTDEFEVLQMNECDTRPGDWGNIIFAHDRVISQVMDVFFRSAADSQTHLVEQAQMFADQCRKRLTVIEEQSRRIHYLEGQVEPESQTDAGTSDQTIEVNETPRLNAHRQQTEIDLLTRLLQRIDDKVAVDVGAERGTMVEALLVGGASSVVAFEPFPANVAALKQRFDKDSRVSVHDAAVSSADGTQQLHVANDPRNGQEYSAYHSVHRFEDSDVINWTRSIDVQSRSLESLVADGTVPRRIGVLKVDTAGHDLDVLRGIGPLRPSLLMIEFWNGGGDVLGRCPYTLEELAGLARVAGYSNYIAVKRNLEFERIEINSPVVHGADHGNAIFVNDAVFDRVADVLYETASAASLRLVEVAREYHAICARRAELIEELNTAATERLELINRLQADLAATSQSPIDTSPTTTVVNTFLNGSAKPAEADLYGLLDRQSHLLEHIKDRIEGASRSYETARQDVEQQFEGRLVRLEQQLRDAQDMAAARLRVIEEQERALTHYRYWSWSARLQRSFAPKLGVLYQHAPRTMKIPDWYLRLPHLTNTPVISIVTPSYNQGSFIERTMRSVLDQQYPSLEYIVQDAASTDDTSSVLERYASSLAHVDSRPDDGFAYGINMGFAHATGEIMSYLNSDDLLLAGSLHYIAHYFATHPEVDVVYGHRVIIDEYDAEIGRWVLPPHDNEILSWADYVPQETLFWRRSIWEKIGGRMDEQFKFAIDWDLLIRLRDAGANIQRLPRFTGAFRLHPHQKTSSSMDQVGREEMAYLRRRVHGRDVTTGEINQAIGEYLRKHVVYHKLYRLHLLRY